MKIYCRTILLMFLLNIVTVLAESEESHPSDEYIQIFRNIPTLFEYLLEVLEERPQILEKNDISVFKRDVNTESSAEEYSKSDIKRDVDIFECRSLLTMLAEDNNSSEEVFKRITDLNDFNKSAYTTERVYATKAHEYGHSNAEYKDTDVAEVRNKEHQEYRFKTDKTSEGTGNNIQGTHKTQEANEAVAKVYKKRQTLEKISLTPEEIEEQAIKVEQILEEHNSKER